MENTVYATDSLNVDSDVEKINDIVESFSEKDFLAKLDLILQSLSDLQICFNEKLENDAHKNKLFDNMHNELIQHRNGIVDKITETMALDIIQLADSIQKYVGIYEQREPNEKNYSDILKIFNGLFEDLQDVLYRQNIEPYSVAGDEVDVRKQKIIQTVDTDDESKNNKVAFRISEGYERQGKIVRPERIKIFKYKPANNNCQ